MAGDGHVIDEEWAAECGAFDKCGKCGMPVQADFYTGRLATMVGRNFECYGK